MRRGGGGTRFARVCALVLALYLSFGWPAQSAAYAVLAHESIIDRVWDTNIRPLGYAFALGALSHYVADNDGYLMAANRAVPLLYPKLKTKYGNLVTYEEDPLAHVKTEFGFDVLEVAQGRYAPDSYHDFIGFGVSVPLLEQAFQDPGSQEQ